LIRKACFQENILALSEISTQEPIATIDMGSNSFHLLIANWHEGNLQSRFTSVERVQTALLMDGARLTPAAEQRVLSCLRSFRQVADAHSCRRIIAVGTSALRQASNADHLLRAAAEVLGAPVIVLSGIDEARLIYQAVTEQQGANDGRKLVIDIGGGSTEVIVGCGPVIEDLESLALGCVSSLKQHFEGGVLSRENFDRSVSAAGQMLQPLVPRFAVAGDTCVLGCSGTALAVATLMGQEHINYGHLCQLRDELLARFSRVEQVQFDGLDHNRSRLLASGLALLLALFEAFSIAEMAVVDVALREGVAIAWYRGDNCLRQELPRNIAI
jgi:exopolyphosphatase/guanosine-5'-triphosphate,3'-diphosphate pyrophosphatase